MASVVVCVGIAALPYLAHTEASSLDMETFGVSYKANGPGGGAWPVNSEVSVFNYTCSSQDNCMMNYFWAGGNWEGYYKSRINYYVDGETSPSVSIPFDLGHGSNMLDDDAPWSSGALFGKTGQPSGIFNSYQVPFSESIRVTVVLGGSRFWLNLRGQANVLPTVSGVRLPANMRLRSHESRTATQKDGLLPIVNTSACQGLVYMHTLSVFGWKSPVFLEGCYRAQDPATGNVRFLLSSGTEDYFLGTYYFNRGKYMNPMAGLTNKNTTTGTFSAYHVHESDPLWFKDGLLMTWRNSDPEGCDLKGTRAQEVVQTSTFALVYESSC